MKYKPFIIGVFQMNLSLKLLVTTLLFFFLVTGTSFSFGLGDLNKLSNSFTGKKSSSPSSSKKSKDDAVTSGLSAFGGLVSNESIDEELEIGKSVGAQVLGASKLLKNNKLQQYVNLVGMTVALQSERPDLPWSFGIIDTSSINAFAAPGGYIMITKGLYDLLETEDELAAVIGHEIAHVLRKHHFNVIKKQKLVKFGSDVISAKNDNQMVQELSNLAGQVMARGLDKSAEYESDRDGLVLAAKAGYDASSLINVLDKIEEHSAHDSSSLSLLFSTHPAPLDRRIELIKAITPEIEDAAIASKAGPRIQRYKP